jgi:hypothetical protein
VANLPITPFCRHLDERFGLVSRVESLLTDRQLLEGNRELISRFNSSGWFNWLLRGLRS